MQVVIPATQVALADTFERIPEFRAAIERSAGTCKGRPSALWVAAPDERDLFEALAADTSVAALRRLASAERRWLVDVEFDAAVETLWSTLLVGDVVLTDVAIRDADWTVECRATDRGTLRDVADRLSEWGFDHDLSRVTTDHTPRPTGDTLSEKQYAAVKRACRLGYFEVPRGVTLEELAEDLDLSHQAVSERLRRGVARCVASGLEVPLEESDPLFEGATVPN